jgi:outer membrane protein assembly factor BamB
MKSHPLLFRIAVSSLLTTALVLTLGRPAAAQLAAGPWSMYRHDVCHTGQSPNLGPLFGTAAAPGTPAAADVKIWHGFDKLRTSPSLSADGKTIFFGMGFDFCSVDTETMTTNECLLLPADVSDSSPAVGANGTIYMGDRDNSLVAYTSDPVTKDLTVKWRYNHGHEGDIWQHPVIAPSGMPAAGTIYFTHDQSTDGAGIFTALTDSGTFPTVKWKYKIGNFVRTSSPAIDRNGRIYFGDLIGYIYAFEDRGACPASNLLCNNLNPPNPSVGPVRIGKRLIGSTPGITASPVISADSNTLYVGTSTGLVALDIRDPESCWATNPQSPCEPSPVKWTFVTSGKVDQTPALGRDGTLYVPAMNGGQKRLYAVNPSDGTQKWVFGPINTGSETSAYPIVGGDERIYVGLGNSIYALEPNTGLPEWSYATTNFIQSSPLIGPVTDGRAILYVPSRDHNLYAISSPRPNTTTPTTCWATDGPIENHAPVADAGADQAVSVNQPVTFNAAASYDPDGDPLTVTWDFGDGLGTFGPCQASAPGCLNPTYTYTTVNAGYIATVTVSDGALSDSDTVTITVTAGGGGVPGTFTDTFSRADNDILGGPNPPPDPQWTEVIGNLIIAGQQLKNGLRGDNIAILPTLVGEAQSASGDFISSDNNASPRLGVLLRVQGQDAARNHYRLYRISGGTSQLRISKLVNGNETVLKYVQVPMATVNTPFHLVGSISGSTLTLTMGAVQITATDSTYASGTIGVLVNTGPAATHAADNFCALIGAGTCP